MVINGKPGALLRAFIIPANAGIYLLMDFLFHISDNYRDGMTKTIFII